MIKKTENPAESPHSSAAFQTKLNAVQLIKDNSNTFYIFALNHFKGICCCFFIRTGYGASQAKLTVKVL